jgi:hypothetical protein
MYRLPQMKILAALLNADLNRVLVFVQIRDEAIRGVHWAC